MASISAFYDVVQNYTVEFDKEVYFRVEVLRLDTGNDIQITSYVAEVYLLKWPQGGMVIPSEKKDTRFRQSWVYLDDFPLYSDSSVKSLRSKVLNALADYADKYRENYKTSLRRSVSDDLGAR